MDIINNLKRILNLYQFLVLKIYQLRKILILFLSIKIISISCDSGEHIRVYRIPKNVIQDNINLNNNSKKNIDFGWQKPTDWKEVSGHSMRLASFEAPFSNGVGDISITTFSGQSGGVGANVNRWLGQMGMNPLPHTEVEKIAINKTSNLGQYLYFRLINQLDEKLAIIASIYRLRNRTVFIKLSSSIKGVNQIEPDFIKFCSSIYKKDEE